MQTKIVFIIFLINGLAWSQPYLPMLEENHTWSVDVYYCTFGGEVYTVTEQLTVSGAVVIDGKTYKRVFNNDGETSCLVREEDGIVYQIDMYNTTEFTKYDFTLEVGDTFSSDISDFCTFISGASVYGPLEVISVTSQFIAGEDRKVIEFDYSPLVNPVNEYWIEGIGSISGFDAIGEDTDVTCGTSLVCFDIAGTNFFFNDATSCDNTTLGISNFEKKDALLFPNPVLGISLLQFSSEGLVDTVKIFDTSGRLVKEEKVTKDYVRIDGMHYRSGLYFYQLFSEKQLLKTEKFIVR
jgi:hypothetical protein